MNPTTQPAPQAGAIISAAVALIHELDTGDAVLPPDLKPLVDALSQSVRGVTRDPRDGVVFLQPGVPLSPLATGTEAEVCADIARRQAHGVAKCGRTVAENPLTPPQWLQHLYEELTDAAIYAKRLLPMLARLHELELYAAHLDGPALERYNATLREVETLREQVKGAAVGAQDARRQYEIYEREIAGLRAQLTEKERKHEDDMSDVIAERDAAEGVITKLCEAIGWKPEWTSAYSFNDAIVEAQERVHAMEQRAETAEARLHAVKEALGIARDYISRVNEDCPPGTDDERDEMLDKLDAAKSGELPRPPDVAAMVSCFLSWRLPATFNPDGGVSFDRNGSDPNSHFWPVGTNLFSAGEAKQMIEHLLTPQTPAP